jgi:hypothetical protein
LTIRATDNTDRFVYGDYNGYRAAGRPYAVGGATIAIAPAVPASGSGLTFTFATPVNAFGLEIADWATCCTSVLHPDTGAPVGSNLFISFDGGATRIVANAINADSNPGNKDYDGDGTTDYAFTNFVAAIDDSRTFSTVTFYGDGLGEALYAGGTLRWAAVAPPARCHPRPLRPHRRRSTNRRSSGWPGWPSAARCSTAVAVCAGNTGGRKRGKVRAPALSAGARCACPTLHFRRQVEGRCSSGCWQSVLAVVSGRAPACRCGAGASGTCPAICISTCSAATSTFRSPARCCCRWRSGC